MRFVVFLVCCFAVVVNAGAYAACSSPDGEEGEMVYNIDYKTMQFCDGTDWIGMGGVSPAAGSGGCDVFVQSSSTYVSVGGASHYCKQTSIDADAQVTITHINENKACDTGKVCDNGACNDPGSVNCVADGELCADGSYRFSYNGVFYATGTSQHSLSWAATGANDIHPDSTHDGEANHSNRITALAAMPAMEYCENLSAHGHSDWYLPARYELYQISKKAEEIGAPNQYHWSSTEDSGDDADIYHLGTGDYSPRRKTFGHYVRCIRRD